MRNISSSTTAYDSTAHLFRRLNRDMMSCHHWMEVLDIVFKNGEGSWLALELAHKIVKDELEEA